MTARIRIALGGLLASGILYPVALAASNTSQASRPVWAAPAAVGSLANPLASRPDTEAGGAKVFTDRCSQCHGADGTGTTFAPGLTGRRVQSESDGALFWKISGGNSRTGMPTFSYLPELQRWQLVLHLRALGSSRRSSATKP